MPTTDLTTLTAGAFAALATGAGAIIWCYILNGAIQVIKGVPQFNGLISGREKLVSFLLAGLLTLLAFIAGLQLVPPTTKADIFGIVLAVLSWLGLARLTMAAYDDTTTVKADASPQVVGERKKESLFNATGWTGSSPANG